MPLQLLFFLCKQNVYIDNNNNVEHQPKLNEYIEYTIIHIEKICGKISIFVGTKSFCVINFSEYTIRSIATIKM